MSIFTSSSSAQVVVTALARAAGRGRATAVVTATATLTGSWVKRARATAALKATATGRPVLAGDPGLLRDVLYSGLARRFPLNFASVPDGLVLAANGIDPMLRWDGSGLSAEVAGVPAPATAPVLTTTGGDPDPLAGEYTAYVRFYDRHGNVSDLSPLSNAAPVRGSFVVDPAHPAVPTGPFYVSTVYTNVPLPTGPYAFKVYGRQILRNTPGQALTYFVDVDTTDLTSTTFTSPNGDAALAGQEAVPLFDEAGTPLANIHGFPPSWKRAVVSHLGRAFATADAVYDEGHVRVAAGSDQVAGVGTQWPASFAGRALYVAGSFHAYGVAAVDAVAQVLTLDRPYQESSALFAAYAIRPPEAEWRLVYFSPAGLPESWPATYALELVEDGDELTGLMSLSSFLYILEKRHIYRFTFKDDPSVDGAVFLSSLRGCLNQRCWVQAEDTAYMLDEQGIHAFVGGQSQPISEPIQDLFRDDSPSPLRVDWDADTRFWHACYSEVHATVRFFVAMTGDRYPRHAICYNYRADRWWVEEYKRPVCSSTRANLGIARVLCGLDHREVMALNVGYSDGLRSVGATQTGAATSSTSLSLTDASAGFGADSVNLAVFLASGPGKGQWRRVVAASATRLDLLTPWLIRPRPGDRYVLGGVDFQWRAGWFRFTDSTESDQARDVEVIFQPVDRGTLDLELFYNHGLTPRTWSRSADGSVTLTAGDAVGVVDLAQAQGRAVQRLEGHLETNAAGDRYVSPRLSGLQAGLPLRVFRLTLGGVEDVG